MKQEKTQVNELKKHINQKDTGLQIIRFIGIILLAWLKDKSQYLIGPKRTAKSEQMPGSTNRDSSQTKQTCSGSGQQR